MGEVAFTDFGYLVLTLWITCSQHYSQFLDYELWWRLLQKHFSRTYSMFSILYHVIGVLDDTGMYYTPHTFCFGPFCSGVVRVVCVRKYMYIYILNESRIQALVSGRGKGLQSSRTILEIFMLLRRHGNAVIRKPRERRSPCGLSNDSHNE